MSPAPSTPAGPAWLFCPADRPERFAKAAAVADVVILDLEDGVAVADKAAARSALMDTPLDPDRTVVRVNAAGTEEQAHDLRALDRTEYRFVMLPKCESAGQVAALAPRSVIGLIETPLGALAVADIAAAAALVALMWGAEDLVAALGGKASRHADGSYRDVARQVRSSTLLAAKGHGRLALDAVCLDIPDIDGLRAEAIDAAAVGFDGKVAVHPTQVPVIRAAYAPTVDELSWATAVLAESKRHGGVFSFRGNMVDAPVLRHAERIVSIDAAVRRGSSRYA